MLEIVGDVNLKLTSWEMNNRWYYERERLRNFPAFELLARNEIITASEGAIDTQYGNSWGIRIELPARYPFSLPTVHPRGWSIHPSVLHQYRDGSICIMRSDQWKKHFTIALVVAKTAVWLAKYEMWKRNGHYWPGLGQAH